MPKDRYPSASPLGSHLLTSWSVDPAVLLDDFPQNLQHVRVNLATTDDDLIRCTSVKVAPRLFVPGFLESVKEIHILGEVIDRWPWVVDPQEKTRQDSGFDQSPNRGIVSS